MDLGVEAGAVLDLWVATPIGNPMILFIGVA